MDKKITTESGFEAHILNDTADDWEFVEELEEYTRGYRTACVKIARRILGEKGLHDLKEHCRDDKGKVSYDKVEAEVFEIIRAARKNS